MPESRTPSPTSARAAHPKGRREDTGDGTALGLLREIGLGNVTAHRVLDSLNIKSLGDLLRAVWYVASYQRKGVELLSLDPAVVQRICIFHNYLSMRLELDRHATLEDMREKGFNGEDFDSFYNNVTANWLQTPSTPNNSPRHLSPRRDRPPSIPTLSSSESAMPVTQLQMRPGIDVRLSWDGSCGKFQATKFAVEAHLCQTGAGYLLYPLITLYEPNMKWKQIHRILDYDDFISEPQFKMDKEFLFGILMSVCRKTNEGRELISRFEKTRDGLSTWRSFLITYGGVQRTQTLQVIKTVEK